MEPFRFIKTKEYAFFMENHLLDINLLFQLTSKILHKNLNLKNQEDIPIILLLDEYRKIQETFENSIQFSWKDPLYKIGMYSVNTSDINKNYNRDHLLINVIISGTLKDDDIKLNSTEYSLSYYKLPLFQFEIILEILKHLVKNSYLPEWSIQPYFYRFWWIMGMIPRTLEIAIQNLKNSNYNNDRSKINENNSNILYQLYQNTMEQLESLYSSYSIYSNIDIFLLQLSCSNINILLFYQSEKNELIQVLENAKRSGKVYLNHDTNTLLLPHPVFIHLNKELQKPFSNIKYFNDFDFNDFEKIDLLKIQNNFELLKKFKIKKVKLKDLFRCNGNKFALDIAIEVNSRTYTEEIEPIWFINKNNEIHFKNIDKITVKSTVLTNNLNQFIFKTYKGCYLVDGRMWLKNEDQEYILFIQYRILNEEINSNVIKEWVESLKQNLKSKFENNLFIYLFVTTGFLSKFQKDYIDSSQDFILFIDRSNIQNYLPTNLYPYLMSLSE